MGKHIIKGPNLLSTSSKVYISSFSPVPNTSQKITQKTPRNPTKKPSQKSLQKQSLSSGFPSLTLRDLNPTTRQTVSELKTYDSVNVGYLGFEILEETNRYQCTKSQRGTRFYHKTQNHR